MARKKSKNGTGTRRKSAYDLILSGIIFADLPAGSAIDEKTLARRFGIGLAAVRDALYRLSLEGLVERHPRIGTRIPDLSLHELHDVFESRVILEGSCAALAAERASSNDVAALRAAFLGYEEAIDRRDFRRLVRMDQVFHRALATATRNKLIEKQITALHKNAARFWYFGLPRLAPSALHADIKAHIDVVDAIERRNAIAAEQAMRAVLGHFPDNVSVFLTSAMSIKEGRSDVRNEINRRERKRPEKRARTAAGVP